MLAMPGRFTNLTHVPLSPGERELAREHARSIASLLSSRVIVDRRIILGWAHCPFKVPFHLEDFWFTVCVSDCTFRIDGNHKKGTGVFTGFCASIKSPESTWGKTRRVVDLSAEVGLDLFAPKDQSTDLLRPVFLDKSVSSILRQIDFSPVHEVFLNGAQIKVFSELTDPKHCADQAGLYRKLLLATFDVSRPGPQRG
jgi:hypothetical protein